MCFFFSFLCNGSSLTNIWWLNVMYVDKNLYRMLACVHFIVFSLHTYHLILKKHSFVFKIKWVNDYHRKTRTVVGDELNKQRKNEEYDWLIHATEPIRTRATGAGVASPRLPAWFLLFVAVVYSSNVWNNNYSFFFKIASFECMFLYEYFLQLILNTIFSN